MKIEVLYKDYHPHHGNQQLCHEQFMCWHEEGSYTTFYKEYVNETSVATIIIPTHAVCWIKPLKEKGIDINE